MSKIGRNKKRCDAYKASGHLQINKANRAERHKKRMERFAKRKEEGKTYKYKPLVKPNKGDSDEKWLEYNNEVAARAAKNHIDITSYRYLRSLFHRLDNKIAKQKLEEKSKKKNIKAEQVTA